jgi:Fe-S-cluster containining protein
VKNAKCCQAFVLGGYSAEEVQQMYDNEVRDVMGEWFDWAKPDNWRITHIVGILDWWSWMIPLGAFEIHPVTGRGAEGGPMEYFTCSQLAENGDCLVYDRRPHFCESYGVTIACEHEDCPWTEARNRRELKRVQDLSELKTLKVEAERVTG